MTNRPILPQGRVEDYQTFHIAVPPDTAIKQVCEDAGCHAYAHGWQTICDERTQLGRARAHYIRWQSGRDFREQKTADGLTVFRFDPFQRCFADHKTIPEVYSVEHGDWRGNPSGAVRTHQSPADWVEHFGLNQQKLAEQHQEGRY